MNNKRTLVILYKDIVLVACDAFSVRHCLPKTTYISDGTLSLICVILKLFSFLYLEKDSMLTK